MVAVKTICGKCGTASTNVHDGYNDCIRDLKRIIYEKRDANEEMCDELAEWRSGKRRVYWKVYDDMGNPDYLNPHRTRADAFDHLYAGGTVKRVTVGPAKKKEAG